LEKARGGSERLEVGQGIRKDKHNYPGPQAEAEDNVHHGVHQRCAGHEEIVGITHHCANTEEGVSVSNGTVSREGSRIPGMGRESQETYSTDLGRLRGIDQ
jgi:hypothetical protein